MYLMSAWLRCTLVAPTCLNPPPVAMYGASVVLCCDKPGHTTHEEDGTCYQGFHKHARLGTQLAVEAAQHRAHHAQHNAQVRRLP